MAGTVIDPGGGKAEAPAPGAGRFPAPARLGKGRASAVRTTRANLVLLGLGGLVLLALVAAIGALVGYIAHRGGPPADADAGAPAHGPRPPRGHHP